MKKIMLGILVMIVLAALAVNVASALPSNPGIEKAKKVSPAIDKDGNVVAPPGFVTPPFPQLPESELTKIVFIRFAPGKEPLECGNGVCEPRENWKNCPNDCPKGEEEPKETACYDFIAGSQPRWNWIEDYYYSDSTLESPSSSAVSTWENATTGDIFRVGVSGTYDWGTYDYVNSLSYGDYDDTGICPTSEPCVIAVTAIWFRGKNIYEYDIMFDIDFFPGDFDLPTVTLHEFGHGAGLNDLYDSACIENVMYGYLGKEEVKTTLGNGDIAGIQKLYGM